MIRFFRFVALVEGITTLALFLIAMPLKYGFGNPVLVPPVGLIHGIAFLIYVLVMVVAMRRRGFSAREWMRTALASLVPFGTFLNDPMLKRKQTILAAAAAREKVPAAPGHA
jgi:integral membrane protein